MSPEQMIFLGIVASALTWVLRTLATYANIHLGRLLVNIVLFVVSGALAVAWLKPALPPFSTDIAAWVMALIQLASPIIAFAALIYNALYSQVVVPLTARFAKQA